MGQPSEDEEEEDPSQPTVETYGWTETQEISISSYLTVTFLPENTSSYLVAYDEDDVDEDNGSVEEKDKFYIHEKTNKKCAVRAYLQPNAKYIISGEPGTHLACKIRLCKERDNTQQRIYRHGRISNIASAMRFLAGRFEKEDSDSKLVNIDIPAVYPNR